MRALMDEVEYNMNNGSGTEVQLVKYRHPSDRETERCRSQEANSAGWSEMFINAEVQ